MKDVSFFGTMMVHKGDADGMVSGAAHSTAHTIRPAFQFIKTKPEFSVVSSVDRYHMLYLQSNVPVVSSVDLGMDVVL